MERVIDLPAMQAPKHLRVYLALLAAVVSALAVVLMRLNWDFIWHLQSYVMLGTWEPKALPPRVPSNVSILWILLSFISGFISGVLLAPFAIRKFFSSSYKAQGFPMTGISIGALCGSCDCLLLLLLNASLSFVGFILFLGQYPDINTTLRFFLPYFSRAAMVYWVFAAAIGATAGAATEAFLRRSVLKARPLAVG